MSVAPKAPPGCRCPAGAKSGQRCDARWIRCNARLRFVKRRTDAIVGSVAQQKSEEGRTT